LLPRTCIQVTFIYNKTYTQQSTIYFIFSKSKVLKPPCLIDLPVVSKVKSSRCFFLFFPPSPRALSLLDLPVVSKGKKSRCFSFFSPSPGALEPSPLELTTGAKNTKVRGTLLFSLFVSKNPPGSSFSILLVVSDAFFLYFT